MLCFIQSHAEIISAELPPEPMNTFYKCLYTLDCTSWQVNSSILCASSKKVQLTAGAERWHSLDVWFIKSLLLLLMTAKQYQFVLYLCSVSSLLWTIFLLRPITQLHCLEWRLIQADFRFWFDSVLGILKSLNRGRLNFFSWYLKTSHLLSERLLHFELTSGDFHAYKSCWANHFCQLLKLHVSYSPILLVGC